ncbi:MAG: 4Fe-4S binding protein [Chitinispirillaceae bacterium]|nr:4Fe-4S binding protein [Chitinispirillaceae bacterium]
MKRVLTTVFMLLTGLFLASHGGADTTDATNKTVKKTALINQAKCIKCGTCAKICPVKAIQIIKKGKNVTYVVDPRKCTGCGECIKKCPSKAIAWAVPPKKVTDTLAIEPSEPEKQKATDAPRHRHGPESKGR